MPNYFLADQAINNNPQLLYNTGLASDVINSNNPEVAASTLLHATNVNAAQQAVQENVDQNGTGGFWQNVFQSTPVEVALKGLEWLNKPLDEVRRDYRYIHSVYTKHGIFEGTLATLGIAGGAIGGFVIGGPIGAVAGMDLVAAAERKLGGNSTKYQDSYFDSEDPNYKVSFGRDLANLMGAKGKTDEGWGKFVSGTGDMFFNLTTDPLILVGKAKAAVKYGKYLIDNPPLFTNIPGVNNFLQRNSLRVQSADQLDALLKTADSGSLLDKFVGSGRQYKRALEDLAPMSAGDVIAKYPELAGLADDIGKAKTVQEVHSIFVDTQLSENMINKFVFGSGLVPFRSVSRSIASKVSDKLRQANWNELDNSVYNTNNAANFFLPRRAGEQQQWIAPVVMRPFSKEAWQGAFAQKTRTLSGYVPYTIDSKTLNLSTHEFDPMDPAALTGIYRVFRYSMSDKLARDMVSQVARAQATSNVDAVKSLYLSGVHEAFKAAGLPDDSKLLTDLAEQIAMLGEGTIAKGIYGVGKEAGDAVSTVVTNNGSFQLALWNHQTGKFAYPDFRELKTAVRSMSTYGKLYGTVDDFAAKEFTDTFFKPLALLTAGFGIRVAASELLPTIFRFGGVYTAKAKIAAASAKMGYKMAKGEDEAIMANAILALQGGSSATEFLLNAANETQGNILRKGALKVLTKAVNEDDFELAARIAIATNGHMATGATLNGHGIDLDAAERQRNIIDLLSKKNSRLQVKEGAKYRTWTAGDDHFDIYYLLNLQKASQNTAQVSIARDVVANLENGMTPDEAWAKARVSEELRIRGQELVAPANIPAPVVSKVSGVPDLVTKTTRKFEISENPTEVEELAFIAKKEAEGFTTNEALFALKDEIEAQRFRFTDEDSKSIQSIKRYVEGDTFERANMQAQLEDVYNKLNKIDDKEWNTPFQKQAKVESTLNANPIIKLIRKSTINEDMQVYRGTSNRLIQDAKVGDVITEPRVMSTTKDMSVLSEFKKKKVEVTKTDTGTTWLHTNELEKELVLTIPAGTNALDIKAMIETYGLEKEWATKLWQMEKEVLLPPKTKFKVTKVTDTAVYATVIKKPMPNPELVNELTWDVWNKIKQQGAITIDVVDGTQPIKGFVVGGATEKAPIIPEEYFYDEYIGPQALEDFIKENIDSLSTGLKYLGAWEHEAHVYLDVSDVFDDAVRAEELGKVRDQISIWDLVKGEEIKTYGQGNKAAQSSFNPEKYQANVPRGTVGLGKTGLGATRKAKVDTYAVERKELGRYNMQNATEFASHRVDDMRNLFTGSNGEVNTKLLKKVAANQKPTIDDISYLDTLVKPQAVVGPELEPYIGPNLINRITQLGFRKVIDPIVSNLSRQPLFFLHVKQEINSGLKNMVEKGILNEDQALRIAMTRATHAMLPQIHNTALRTQFGVLVRNYLPFYFAQEQAMKRTGKLIAENPNAFRQYQLTEHAINDPGFVQTDDNGNRYLMVPMIGELGGSFLKAAAAIGLPVVGGLPVSVTGDMRSLATVLPEIQMPGVSPIVSIAGNALGSIDPVLAKGVKATIGERAFGTTIMDNLIPNSPARNAFKALNADERDRAFLNATLSALAAAAYNDQLPPPDASPAEKQDFLDRIKNNARSILLIKTMLSAISPLSPQVSQEDPGLRNEFYQLVKEKGDYPTALQEFIAKHGSKAVSYTVSRSEAVIKGVNTPYTTEAFEWIQNNENLIKSQNGVGALFLVPQTNGEGDVQLVHDELLKLNLRERRSPQDFMNALYVASGNNLMSDARAKHMEALNAVLGDREATDAENANWAAFQKQFGQMNPIWWDDWASQDRKHIGYQAVADLNEIFANGLAPKNEQSTLVYGLFTEWKQHQQNLANARLSGQRGAVTDENDAWALYLETVKTREPRLATIINSVFSRIE